MNKTRVAHLLLTIVFLSIISFNISCKIAKVPEELYFSEGVLIIKSEFAMKQWMEHSNWDDEKQRVREATDFPPIKWIIIGSDVDVIPDRAFMQLECLEYVYISEGVRGIGEYAFEDCINVREIFISNTIETIGIGAFTACEKLRRIEIPIKLTIMPDGMFYGCDSLTELYIPKEVSYIGNSAIKGDSIEKIVFEGTIERIEKWRIEYMPEIKQLVFLENPPENYIAYTIPDSEPGHGNHGWIFSDTVNPTVYYLEENKEAWAPNGETEWEGMPLVAIKSLDDLPSLE
jgi:hypothetical protein